MESRSEHQPSPPLSIRIAGIIALFFACTAINWLYIPAASWHGALNGDAGEVLYAAGFDGFTDEWREYDGREFAQIESGALRIGVEESASVIYSPAQPVFDDFDVRVDTRAVAGMRDDEANNAFGIVFRLQEPRTDCRLPLQILCDVGAANPQLGGWLTVIAGGEQETTGFMLFLISSDGYYSVWRGTEAGTTRISTWIASDAINQGLDADNRLRVVGRGDRYQFFINGTQVDLCIPTLEDGISTYYLGACIDGTMQDTLVDDSFDRGQLALAIDSVNSTPTFTVEFDNFVVIAPPATDAQAVGDQT